MKNKEFILPVAIVVGCIALGGFYYGVQINKQNSIEKQQQIKIEDAREARESEEQKQQEEERELEAKEAQRKQALSYCLQKAEKDYWTFMELNGTKNEEGTINALVRFWDTADKNKQQAISNCIKLHQ